MSTIPDTQSKTVSVREVSYDGIMPDRDVVLVTGLSRVTLWRLEGKGMFPKRVQLSPGRVGRIGKEVKAWVESRPRVGEGET